MFRTMSASVGLSIPCLVASEERGDQIVRTVKTDIFFSKNPLILYVLCQFYRPMHLFAMDAYHAVTVSPAISPFEGIVFCKATANTLGLLSLYHFKLVWFHVAGGHWFTVMFDDVINLKEKE